MKTLTTATAMSRGSQWTRWDLHVHTPNTALNDQFADWQGYVDTLRSCTQISVVGVTDYASIHNYERLLAEHEADKLGSIELLIPNIEFRITPQTAKGHAINLHLLVDPTQADHVQRVHSALARLSFTFNDQPYSCTKLDLIRLGGDFDKSLVDETAKFRAGVGQYKVDFSKESLRRG